MDFLGYETKGFVQGEGITNSIGLSKNLQNQPCSVVVGEVHGRKNRNGRVHFERVNKGRTLCVLVQYVTYDMVEALSERALVGRFEYIKLSREEILS